MSWIIVLVAFALLSGFRLQAPAIATEFKNGIELQQLGHQDPHHPKLTGVRGTVMARTLKPTGMWVLNLQADDGSPVTVTVPPSVNAEIPDTYERVEVVGQLADPGLINLVTREGLKPLAPKFEDKPMPTYDWPRYEAKNTTDRFITTGQLDIQRHTGRKQSVLAVVSREGMFVVNALLSHKLDLQDAQDGQLVTLSGYMDAHGQMIVETIK